MKKIVLALAIAAAAMSAASSMSFAKHGADDPAGHVRGEGAGHP
jgi:hypothetical protein